MVFWGNAVEMVAVARRKSVPKVNLECMITFAVARLLALVSRRKA